METEKSKLPQKAGFSIKEFLIYWTILGLIFALSLWPIFGLKYAALSLVGWFMGLICSSIFSSFLSEIIGYKGSPKGELTIAGLAPLMSIFGAYAAKASDTGRLMCHPLYYIFAFPVIAVVVIYLCLYIADRTDNS